MTEDKRSVFGVNPVILFLCVMLFSIGFQFMGTSDSPLEYKLFVALAVTVLITVGLAYEDWRHETQYGVTKEW